MTGRPNPSPTTQAFYARALELLDLGRPMEAAQCLTNVASQEPTNAEAFALMGKAFRQAGRPDLAAQPLRTALSLSPDHAGAQADLRVVGDHLGEDASPRESDPKRLTAAVVTVAMALFVSPALLLGGWLGAPWWIYAIVAGLALGAGFGGWHILVEAAKLTPQAGQVTLVGRRAVRTYWRRFLVAGLLVGLTIAAFFLPFDGASVFAAVLSVPARGALAYGLLSFAPGARPLYALTDHPNPQRRSLVIRRFRGLRLYEDQILAVRMERAELQRGLGDMVLGAWRLMVHVAHDGVLGQYVVEVHTPEAPGMAAHWRNEVTKLISEGRKFTAMGNAL